MNLLLALRALRRAPTFTLACVLSLGLALGANLTVFTWLEHLVLNPYPAVREPDRLVVLNTAAPGGDGWPIARPVFEAWRTGNTSLSGMAAWVPARVAVRQSTSDRIEPAWAMLVSGDYFEVLGLRMAMGRGLQPADESSRAPVAVLSEAYWRRRFGADSSVIGSTIQAGSLALTIVGVAPRGFAGTYVGVAMDLFVPLTTHTGIGYLRGSLDDRQVRWLQGVARLRPGVSTASARRDLEQLSRSEAAAAGDTPVLGALLRLPRQQFLGDIVFPLFTAMLAVTAVIVLSACANVANLLLARATARERELAVRAALGASRGRLLLHLLAESALLAGAGGLAGYGVAALARGWFTAFVPPMAFTLFAPMELNGRITAYALGATALTVLAFGLLPALRASGSASSGIVRGSVITARRGARLRGTLVVAQVALSALSLILAGLFLRSVAAAARIPLGFTEPEQVLLVTTELRLGGIPDSSGPRLLEELLSRAATIPGVRLVSAATAAPLGFAGFRRAETEVEGYVPAREESMALPRQGVAPAWFATMGIEIRTGREFLTSDRKGTLPVAVVSEGLAKKYWAGRDPIGRRVNAGDGWRTVVGVAADIKVQSLDDQAVPVVYVPLLQTASGAFTLHLRAADPEGLLPQLRRVYRDVHPDLPALDIRTLHQHASAATFPQRLGAGALGGFGLLALVLAAVGVSGVMTCVVSLRRRELGVRLALGGTPGALQRGVLGSALQLTGYGLVLGSVLAVGVGRLIQSQLIGLGPLDAPTYGGTGLVLLLVALGAAWIPARRASRTDPLECMREA